MEIFKKLNLFYNSLINPNSKTLQKVVNWDTNSIESI